MTLERLFWNEDKQLFVKFNSRNEKVNPQPLGFPTSFYVCKFEIDEITDEQAIEEHAPTGANAYCSGKICIPNITDSPQRCSYGVQYYRIVK